MEEDGKRLDLLMKKKMTTEKNIQTSYLTHLAFLLLDVLLIAGTLKIIGNGNIVRILLSIAISVFMCLVMYLTIVSFMERTEAELRSFWHVIYIMTKKDKHVVRKEHELNFMGRRELNNNKEVSIDEITEVQDVNTKPR